MTDWRCWLFEHDAMLTQKRDSDGRLVKPHALVWECHRCHRVVGETVLDTRWKLLAHLRRQAAALKRRAS
jgi:hypothetical protein